MKLSRSGLRRLILNEMKILNEECPTGLPCPVAAANELKQAGASPEEMLDWIAKLTQELLSPVDRPGEGAPEELGPVDGLDLGDLSALGDLSSPEEL